jgi:signal transduction histidine kinase/Na+/proline symporter
MTLELGTLVVASLAYLLVLFLIAYAAERGRIPSRFTQHPLVFALALGVYATSWSYFGSVGYAAQHGFRYLGIYLGATLSCLLVPVLWRPLLKLTRELQLTSLADLFAFRYPGQATGTLVTLVLLAGTLPYLALQVRAIVESARVLSPSAPANLLGPGFCAITIVFSILFGARHLTPRERHEGLALAIAFESLVKGVALVLVGAWAVVSIFGGPGGLQAWLDAHPEALRAMQQPAREASWAPLLVLSCAAAFLIPRQYHVAFTESPERDALSTATWAFPLLLLLMNMAVPLVLWSGTALGLPGPADFHMLAVPVARGAHALALLGFLGGISAASAMVIVTTLAMAPMCLTHLVLPLGYARAPGNLYRRLLWARRVLIAAIILAGYGFYLLLDSRAAGLVDLGLVSFVGVAQFFPGLLGLLFWPRATRVGFLSGLAAGTTAWGVLLLRPLWIGNGLPPGATALAALLGFSTVEPWGFVTFTSLTLNALAFVGLSLATRPSTEEAEAARLCAREAPSLAGSVTAGSPEELRRQLASVLGADAAVAELDRALAELGLSPAERRPAELRRLRELLERNLSGLLGPVLARLAVSEALQVDPQARTALAEQLRFVEERLRDASGMKGPVRELEAVRRYLQRILEELPLGACALGPDQDVVIWNAELERLSGLKSGEVRGQMLSRLPPPWGELLSGFASGADADAEARVRLDGRERILRLHRSLAMPSGASEAEPERQEGAVLLVEDLTERKAMDARLAHQDRLASVGRVAAGVAHEIGNPLTAITSVAQNLRYEEDPTEIQERVQLILKQAKRIDAIVRALVTFSHAGVAGGHGQPVTRVPLAPLLTEAAQLSRLGRKGADVKCVNHCPESLEAVGNTQRLVQVFVNLVTNAIDASPRGGRVELFAEEVGERVRVRVVDQGHGIPPELAQRIFEPFFTTKQPGEGTGLGLALVSSIIREHGGTLEVDSQPGAGATFTVTLPKAMAPRAAG